MNKWFNLQQLKVFLEINFLLNKNFKVITTISQIYYNNKIINTNQYFRKY